MQSNENEKSLLTEKASEPVLVLTRVPGSGMAPSSRQNAPADPLASRHLAGPGVCKDQSDVLEQGRARPVEWVNLVPTHE